MMVPRNRRMFGFFKKKGIWTVVVISALSFVAFQGNCSAKKMSDSAGHSAGVSKKIAEYEQRLEKLLSPIEYRYSPVGKPDPFKPFFKTVIIKKHPAKKGVKKDERPSHCDTPLECMDVGQLTLVAIIHESDGTPLAMAQDASGIGYVLRPGMRIGYRKGRIVSIGKEKVVVREKVENLKGELVNRDRIMYLHPEESK